MNRIEKKFNALRKNKEKALVVFITAGYPDLGTTYKLILELEAAGADIIELGVPFSDPMADGPVIQEASGFALKKGVNLARILDLVKNVRQRTQIPICLMTYYNPVFCYGEERFCRVSLASGVDGVIIPDLPPEEAGSFIGFARKCDLDFICFVSPTTGPKRMRHICNISRGFIYYVSLTGTTGARRDLAPDLIKNLKAIKSCTRKPVCAGFGVSTAEQVKKICAIADGVIVGSAVVSKIKQSLGKADLVKKVGRFVSSLGTVLKSKQNCPLKGDSSLTS